MQISDTPSERNAAGRCKGSGRPGQDMSWHISKVCMCERVCACECVCVRVSLYTRIHTNLTSRIYDTTDKYNNFN